MITEPTGVFDMRNKISPKHTSLLMKNDVFKGDNLKKSHFSDAGYDIRSADDLILYPNIPTHINTGLSVAIPVGYEGEIKGRSGLAFKWNVFCIHNGDIDAGFRSTIKVLLINMGDAPYKINKGDRIAQMVVRRVELGDFMEVDELPHSDDGRGNNGYGSTGV